LIKDINANEQLVPNAIALLEDKNQQEKLSRNIKLFAKPNAANEIAQTILGQL
jgi:UDP-N-acetylglucosamine--N-acetylmuramyl-(pentapeptide) pyrophosphoryl-undecaprenol N-acetylglucosamine transferase